MVKEGLKKILPVMQAFVEGKTIQRYDDKKDDWYDISPNANIDFCYDYRIKPEPKYRPFKTIEECWEEMHKHPDCGWVVAKNRKIMYHIESVEWVLVINGNSYTFDDMYQTYTFLDDTPFGLKEEQ